MCVFKLCGFWLIFLASVRVGACRPNEPCVSAFFLFGARHAFAVRVKITRAQVPVPVPGRMPESRYRLDCR